MKLHSLVAFYLLGLAAANAMAASEYEAGAPDINALWKRRGGGGGGGRGGGGGSSGGSGRSGGSSGSGRSSPARPGQPGFAGSGPPRAYGGGRYYGGGVAAPYTGRRSPSGIVGLVFVGAALAFWPGLWLYGATLYHFNDHYRFRNDTSGSDEDLPVICACDPYNPCGCDENNDTEYVESLIGSGAYNELNHSLATVAEVNGTKTLLINGTLPNGTEPPVPEEDEGAGPGMRTMIEALGYWPMVAAVLSAVFMV